VDVFDCRYSVVAGNVIVCLCLLSSNGKRRWISHGERRM